MKSIIILLSCVYAWSSDFHVVGAAAADWHWGWDVERKRGISKWKLKVLSACDAVCGRYKNGQTRIFIHLHLHLLLFISSSSARPTPQQQKSIPCILHHFLHLQLTTNDRNVIKYPQTDWIEKKTNKRTAHLYRCIELDFCFCCNIHHFRNHSIYSGHSEKPIH